MGTIVFCAALAIAFLIAPPLRSETIRSTTGAAPETVRVGVYQNPPKIFMAPPDSRVTGLFGDIVAAIAAKEGWKIQYVPGTWNDCMVRLESGQIDIMVDVAWSEERAARYDFNQEAVFSNWGRVYAGRSSRIDSLLDLGGKRIAVMDGSIHTTGRDGIVELARKFDIACTFVAVPDYDAVFRLIEEGAADAGVVNRVFGDQHARDSAVRATPIIFNPNNLYFAFPKSGRRSAHYAARIDADLRSMKADDRSVYYQALERHLGGTATRRVEVLPAWWPEVLGAVAALVALVLGFNFFLRMRIDRATEEIRKLNAGLEDRVAERTAELVIAKDEAESADRLKSAFLATMSHELRTPLNSIIGFTGILLQELPGPINSEQQKQLSMVQNSARHLLALINDVLDISKIEAGQMTIVHETFDLRASLERVVNTVNPLAEKKALICNLAVDQDVGAITGDRRRFEQIVMNLLSNAVKFTESGRIDVACRRSGALVETTVRDTGIGIRKEDIDGLFRPFAQVDSGLTRRYEGTGLGLSISRRLVEMMGGSIRVESEPGKGSAFTFVLPATGGSAA